MLLQLAQEETKLGKLAIDLDLTETGKFSVQTAFRVRVVLELQLQMES